jgi:hypothetical protein
MNRAAKMPPMINLLKTAIFRGKLKERTVFKASESEIFGPETRLTRKGEAESAIKTKETTALHTPRRPPLGKGAGMYTMSATKQTRKHAQHTIKWKQEGGQRGLPPFSKNDRMATRTKFV